MLPEIRRAEIVITNYHAFQHRETLALPKVARSFLQGNDPEPLKTTETDAEMLARACGKLLNYDRVLRACEVMCDPCGLAIEGKAITLSTVGIVPGIRRFTAERRTHRLIVSLTAADSDKRRRLFPVENTHPLDELMDALTLRQTGRLQAIPILLYGTEYWKRVLDFQFLADEGAIRDADLSLIQYVDDPQQAWDAIRAFHAERPDDEAVDADKTEKAE